MPPVTSTKPSGSEPAWEIARLFPDQGQWGEGDYLLLTQSTNRLAEFSGGRIEILPMPKTSHQLIVAYLYRALLAFVSSRQRGTVLFAPLRVRLPQGTFREPDVVFMLAEHAARTGEDFWEGADLAMEVVSDENREHDLVTKRAEYAAAGIPEYWIVDPRERTVTVLRLADDAYAEDGVYRPGQRASSPLLPGFEVDVQAVLAAAEQAGGTRR
jgi:Uma2 family endonuclease